MASEEQKMMVAQHCPGYNGIKSGFEATVGAQNSESCNNCRYFRNDKCQKHIFDDVLTSLDQT